MCKEHRALYIDTPQVTPGNGCVFFSFHSAQTDLIAACSLHTSKYLILQRQRRQIFLCKTSMFTLILSQTARL